MSNGIAIGSIWMEDGIRMPDLLPVQHEFHASGWTAMNGTCSSFEKEIEAAGWTLFYMAGEIKVTVFGPEADQNLASALKKLIKDVKAQHFNGVEITGVARKSFLKVPYIRVTAHARHLQMGATYSGTPQFHTGTGDEHHEDSTPI